MRRKVEGVGGGGVGVGRRWWWWWWCGGMRRRLNLEAGWGCVGVFMFNVY